METQSPIKMVFFPQVLHAHKKRLNVQGVSKLKYLPPKKNGNLSFFNVSEIWSNNFKLNFLSYHMAKMQNYSVHQMRNFLNLGLIFNQSPFLAGVIVKNRGSIFLETHCIEYLECWLFSVFLKILCIYSVAYSYN